MFKKITHALGCTMLLLAANPANAANHQDVALGGVDLNYWCGSQYGSGFTAKLIGSTAGDWTCEAHAGNRRPISVDRACKQQYGNKAYKAQATDWNNPHSWQCFERKQVATKRGVDLSHWCRTTFGSNFTAKLIGGTAGDWACEDHPGNRRPISVENACRLQWGNGVFKAEATNWNNPHSWKCYIN